MEVGKQSPVTGGEVGSVEGDVVVLAVVVVLPGSVGVDPAHTLLKLKLDTCSVLTSSP